MPAAGGVAMQTGEPTKAAIFSDTEPRNLANRPSELCDGEASPGQVETKSPPGPNLQTGSACLFKRLSFPCSFLSARNRTDYETFQDSTANMSIGNRPVKTLTKPEQKPANFKNFLCGDFVARGRL